MPQGGFFEQKRSSPGTIAAVIVAHGAVLTALAIAKGPEVFPNPFRKTQVTFIPIQTNPPPEPEPRIDEQPRAQQRSQIDRAPPPIPLPQRDPVTPYEPRPLNPPIFSETPIGKADVPAADPPADPPPVRIDAQLDPRFAGALQPLYPASEQRAGNEGTVTIQVTIGAEGRVTATQKVRATSDAFYAATERQARTRWRFRPATLGGRPVESSKAMTVHFRIDRQ